MLCDADWSDANDLRSRVSESKIGLIDMRTKAIWRLCELLREDPVVFDRPRLGRSWVTHRDHLVGSIHGIGRAKVSFALEMCYPLLCRVICVDTHIMQLYGYGCGHKLTDREYAAIEDHWTGVCQSVGYPPAIVRHILWDAGQGQPDTRYWSDVFENERTQHVRYAANNAYLSSGR